MGFWVKLRNFFILSRIIGIDFQADSDDDDDEMSDFDLDDDDDFDLDDDDEDISGRPQTLFYWFIEDENSKMN